MAIMMGIDVPHSSDASTASSYQSSFVLFDTAKSEALEAVLLIENIVETIGWTLDYQDLLLAKNNKGVLAKEEMIKKLES